MAAPHPLEIALSDSGLAAGRIESIKKALNSDQPVTPRARELIAEGMDDPLLADFLAQKVARRVGQPLAGALRTALFVGGDLPDAARLRALVFVEGKNAVDVLQACLKDGSDLLREMALEIVAAEFPDERRLVNHCFKLLTPLTSMPLGSYFAGKLFSIRHGLPCPAAVTILSSAGHQNSGLAAEGAHRFFGSPSVLQVLAPRDDLPAGLEDEEGPLLDLPVERLLEMLAKPMNLADLVSTVRMLGHSGDPRALEPLLDALRHERILDFGQVPSSYAHDALTEAIVGVGGQAAGRPLGKFVLACASDNDYAFFAALGAIHTHRLAGSLSYLTERLRSPWSHQSTPSLLVAAICRIGGSEAARLTFEAALAQDTPEGARPHLLHAFTGLADQLTSDRQAITARLLKLVPGAREGSTKTALLEALNALGGESAGLVLRDRALNATRSAERSVAWRGLGNTGGPEALKTLLAGLGRQPSDLQESLAILAGLSALGDEGAVAALVAELDRECRWQLRLAIIDTLGTIGSPQALPRLQDELSLPAYSKVAPAAWAKKVEIEVGTALKRFGGS